MYVIAGTMVFKQIPVLLCALKFLCFLATASWNVSAASTVPSAVPVESNSSMSEYHIEISDEVIFLACSNHPSSHLEHPFMRTLPRPWMLWSSPHKTFYRKLEQNTHKGVYTLVLLLGGPQEHDRCSRLLKTRFKEVYMTDWLHFYASDASLQLNNGVEFGQTFRACATSNASSPKASVCLSLERATVLSRKYGLTKSDEGNRPSKAFSGQTIVLACTRLKATAATRLAGNKSYNCHNQFFKEIEKAFVAYNATLPMQPHESMHSAVVSMIHGKADVLMRLIKSDEEVMELLSLPRPARYSYETFYSRKHSDKAEVSFFAVLQHSRQEFLILIVVMILVWLSLSFWDYLYVGGICTDAVLDSAMFLVASFLANSAPTHTVCSRHTGRRWRHARMITLGAWMLGILPLSVYFRSELTSRLTVTIPPEYMDTLAKLESALDKQEVQICIVRDGCLHAVVDGSISYRNQTLHTKLRQAFRNNKKGMQNIFNNPNECLQCASKPASLCFSCGLAPSEAEDLSRRYVQSREALNLAFATTPVRKDYPLFRAYDQVLQRLFETALNPFNGRWVRPTTGTTANRQTDAVPSEEGVTQVFQLSAFLATFASAMFFSGLVFCVELILGRRRKVRFPSL